MDRQAPGNPDASTAARRLARGVLAIARTRVELLLVEVQEERARWFQSILLILGCASCAFLACIALTIGAMAVLWPHSPVLAIALPSGIHTVVGVCLYRRLAALRREWQTLPSTFEQLRKDRECLETWLG